MMKFYQIAINNVLRNHRIYLAYFLSSLFTVMVFFTFANFAFHPTLTENAMNRHVITGMLVAGWIIYIFSFFFILYSMSSFLQSRKREFGLFMIQGMSSRQVRWLVFIENMMLGFLAVIFGIGSGVLFSKAILLVAEKALALEDQLPFYFPKEAITLTFVSFILLFFFISLFMTNVLRTKKLVTLIQGEKIAKKEPRASILLTLLAALLLGIGYYMALKARGVGVMTALIPVVLLVIIGTYFLFTQLSVFFIRRMKNHKGVFWQGTNMLLLSDLTYRMKDNARAFFLVAIISTVAFSAIGTLVGFNSLIVKSVRSSNPLSFEYTYSGNEKDLQSIEETFEKYNLTVERAQIELTYFEQNDRRSLITTPKTYNAYARLIGEKEIRLKDEDVIVVGKSDANLLVEDTDPLEMSIRLADGREVYPNEELMGRAKPNVLPEISRYFIVSDELFAKLPEPDSVDKKVGWQVLSGSKDNIIEAGRVLSEEYLGFMAIDWFIYDLQRAWGVVLFVGLFVGVVFFISAGSFLYFRLYRDLEEDKYKFAAINKIGLTTKELKRVINRQIGLLFFAPIVVAIIHGAVALTALANMFERSLLIESSIVLGCFFIIQVIYFFVVKYFYTKQIKRAIY